MIIGSVYFALYRIEIILIVLHQRGFNKNKEQRLLRYTTGQIFYPFRSNIHI